jgi:hypothetical protein
LTHMDQVQTRRTALTRFAAEIPRAARTRHPPPRERHPHQPNNAGRTRRVNVPVPKPPSRRGALPSNTTASDVQFVFLETPAPRGALALPPPPTAKPRRRVLIDDPFATSVAPKRVPSANSGAVPARAACMVGPVTRVEKDCLLLKFDRLILESAIFWKPPGRPVCTRVPKERRCCRISTTSKRLLRASNQRKSRALVLSGAIQ